MTSLNLCSLLEKYCYSKRLTEKEIEFLERSWFDSLNSKNYNRYPGIAPTIVCDEAGLDRGSYWISCNAAILDKLSPLGEGLTRISKIIELLNDSGLTAA